MAEYYFATRREQTYMPNRDGPLLATTMTGYVAILRRGPYFSLRGDLLLDTASADYFATRRGET